MRVGILTGGGDCPGLNAVIRAATLRVIRVHGGTVVGFEDGYRGLLAGRTRELDLKAVAGILPRGGTILGTSRCDPIREGGNAAIRSAFAAHGMDGLLVCGGDGTLRATLAIAELGLPVIGIPKTIDNDVPGTDFSCGFDTALNTVVGAVDALHTTADSHDRVIVVEVMGRDAGWLAVCAGIAGGADFVAAPEEPVSLSEVCEGVRHRLARGRTFSIVVVAEGARFRPDPDGYTIETPQTEDAQGRRRYGGIGEVVAREIEKRVGVDTRTVTLGYVQRGGTPTAFDRLLGSRMGVAAADLAERGRFGLLVSLRGGQVAPVPLTEVLAERKTVDHELYETARTFFG